MFIFPAASAPDSCLYCSLLADGWSAGGSEEEGGGEGVAVGAVGVAVGEAAATNRGRQMDGSHLPERSKARSADMAYVSPPPTQISSSGSPLSSPAVLLFLFSPVSFSFSLFSRPHLV